MDLDLGLAASGASSAESGGPFYNDASINFGSRGDSNPYMPNSPNTVSDATSSAKSPGAGSTLADGAGLTGTASSGSSMLWIVILAGGALAVWLLMKRKA